MYRGKDANGGDVYYILTESNDVDQSFDLKLNRAPKLYMLLVPKSVQNATVEQEAEAAYTNIFFNPNWRRYAAKDNSCWRICAMNND
ncbi:hypothetical protein BH20BAC1_BH20BAC1_24170 [soil metagenome]